MPQEIRVLQCFDCLVHQADIVKKTNKWDCKMCGAKQSVRDELFRGTGAECRVKAQELNMAIGKQSEEVNKAVLESLSDADNDENAPNEQANEAEKIVEQVAPPARARDRDEARAEARRNNFNISKWLNFVAESENENNMNLSKLHSQEQAQAEAEAEQEFLESNFRAANFENDVASTANKRKATEEVAEPNNDRPNSSKWGKFI